MYLSGEKLREGSFVSAGVLKLMTVRGHHGGMGIIPRRAKT
jgi:hypothetical protein